MPDGTTINETFVPRLHRSNAREVLEESESDIWYLRIKLHMLAAATPGDIDELQREVSELLEWYDEVTFKAWAATMILEEPENCKDDYDARS